MIRGFEFFDHTADVGVRLSAPSLPELLRVAGEGLYAAIGELVAEGRERPERFELAGSDLAGLLREYLSEILLLFEQEQRMITRLDVEVFEPGRLIAQGESRPVSRSKSALEREVKAVTYHGLGLHPVAGGYEGTFIVDV
jgi:SHS2 domain-containing protein